MLARDLLDYQMFVDGQHAGSLLVLLIVAACELLEHLCKQHMQFCIERMIVVAVI